MTLKPLLLRATVAFLVWIPSPLHAAADPFPGPGFPELREQLLIRGKEITSVQDLLVFFQKDRNYRPLLQNFTVLYHSECQGKEAVSSNTPGIIAFYGKLLLSFTSNPQKPELYNQVNVIEFEPKEARFRFHQIQFGSDKSAGARTVENPHGCTDCHGIPARPNWGSFPFWPGALEGNSGLSSLMPLQEKLHFRTFCNQIASKERYKPFDISAYCKGHSILSGVDKSPNRAFSDLLNRMNFLRISREISRNPAYRQYKFALAAAAQDCPDPEKFLPEAVRKQHEAKLGMNYEALQNDTAAKVQAEYDRRVALYNSLNSLSTGTRAAGAELPYANEEIKQTQWISRYRFLLEGNPTASVSIAGWSLSYPPKGTSYSFALTTENSEGLASFRRSLLGPLARELASLPAKKRRKKQFCEWLMAKSHASFQP